MSRNEDRVASTVCVQVTPRPSAASSLTPTPAARRGPLPVPQIPAREHRARHHPASLIAKSGAGRSTPASSRV